MKLPQPPTMLGMVISFLTFFSTPIQGTCSNSQVIDDYTYCQQVTRAVISNVGHSGTYQKTTGMDENSGVSSSPFAFSGPLAPLDEDLSVHFRGPINLKQFAVYIPSTKNTKRDDTHHGHFASHARHHGRRHAHQTTVIDVVDIEEKVVVESTLGGGATTYTQFLAMTNTESPSSLSTFGQFAEHPETSQRQSSTTLAKVAVPSYEPESSTLAAQPVQSSTSEASRPTSSVNEPSSQGVTPTLSSNTAPPSSSSSQPNSSQSSSLAQLAPGDWSQTAYYSSESKTSNGLVFMNNQGGQGSGVWSHRFGNSISYADATAKTAAKSPTIFQGFLDNNVEMSVFSDTNCTDACGFSRPGAPAYCEFSFS
jgi:Tos1-like cell wall protein